MPDRHFDPAGEEHSRSLAHVDGRPPLPASLPTGTQAGIPPLPASRRQTKLEGQPDIEQSSAWHLLSAPQFCPLGQSLGLVHVEPSAPTGRQRWSLAQAYPLGHATSLLHRQVLHSLE